jgi:hypothetical protein
MATISSPGRSPAAAAGVPEITESTLRVASTGSPSM